MTTFMASIASVARISGLLYRGSSRVGRSALLLMNATDDRSRPASELLLHNNATILMANDLLFLKKEKKRWQERTLGEFSNLK